MAEATFSESWHLVSGLRVRIRPTVEIQRQFYRGEKWYVLRDPLNNSFFRVRPSAYAFVMRLDPVRTVEDAWLGSIEESPDDAPGQEDVVSLLGQLYSMNLLETELPPDSRRLFARYDANRKKELRSKLMNIMFIRIPLFDPEVLLRRLSRFIKFLVGPYGAVAWAGMAIFAIKLVVERADELFVGAQGVLAADNLFLLYLGLVLVKSFHEFGHAAVCHRYGGEVHTIGVMLMMFTPLPYVDATSSWGFRSRWHRAFVGAAGMIFELFAASVAAVYWALSGEGVLHSLAYNIMFVASVSTILFNANPLLRLDGYYILSDLVDLPNLHSRATAHLKYLLERHLFSCEDSLPSVRDLREASELTLFGILSLIYKVVVFGGIILFISDKWLILGTIMTVAGVIGWVVVPTVRFISYLMTDARLARCRNRIYSRSLFLLGAFAILAVMIPFPRNIDAPGVIESAPEIKVVNGVPGYLAECLVVPGQRVRAGQPLVRLVNPDLGYAVRGADAKIAEVKAKERYALGKRIADLPAVRKEANAVYASAAELHRNERDLLVRARGDGLWIPAGSEIVSGRWFERGSHIGDIVGGGRYRFAAVVSQEDAAELFGGALRGVDVRLWGQAHISVGTSGIRLIPYQHEKLPSPALGLHGGGAVPVTRKEGDGGISAAEPFFLVQASLNGGSGAQLIHGRSGTIRFSLAPEPLAFQWIRRAYQIFQKRYRL